MLVVFYRNICFFRYCPFIPDGKPCFRHQYLRGGFVPLMSWKTDVTLVENGARVLSPTQSAIFYFGDCLPAGRLGTWHVVKKSVPISLFPTSRCTSQDTSIRSSQGKLWASCRCTVGTASYSESDSIES